MIQIKHYRKVLCQNLETKKNMINGKLNLKLNISKDHQTPQNSKNQLESTTQLLIKHS